MQLVVDFFIPDRRVSSHIHVDQVHALQRKTGDHHCALLTLDAIAMPHAKDLQLVEEVLSTLDLVTSVAA